MRSVRIIVDKWCAHGAGKAQPIHLYRHGPQGQNAAAAGLGEPGQIHQNVYAVLMYLFGSLILADGQDIVKMIECLLQPLTFSAGIIRRIGISVALEVVTVMQFDDLR